MKALVPLDGSENSLRIFSSVRRLIGLQPALEVHLLTVMDPRSARGRSEHVVGEPPAVSYGRGSVTAPLPRLVESHGEALDREAGEHREWLHALALKEIPGSFAVEHVEWSSNAAETINKLADELQVEVVVMASHGHSGLKHMVAGSVTEAVIRTSKRPVLVQGPLAS